MIYGYNLNMGGKRTGVGQGNETTCEKKGIHLGIGFSRESHLAVSEMAVDMILWLPKLLCSNDIISV